jgi:D-lactate dehydrogenase (cytochrome)
VHAYFIVSLDKCNTISAVYQLNGSPHITLGAGVSLSVLDEYLKEHAPDLCFPVDPTERWGSFGGFAATNASGARSLRYSSVRAWIHSIEVVTAQGDCLTLERGKHKLDGSRFLYKDKEYEFPSIPKPPTKNCIGYSYEPGMDILDLFIGSEGTLGVITEVVVRLDRKPGNILSLLQFFSSPEKALSFIVAVRDRLKDAALSLEFLDDAALGFAMSGNACFTDQIEGILKNVQGGAVFAEFSYESEGEFEELLLAIEAEVAALGEEMENGVCALTETEVLEMKKFRHAVPEALNALVAARKRTHPALRKVATDMAVPKEHLHTVYHLYRSCLEAEGLEFAIFGHAGDNHFHVNILPQTPKALEQALNVYRRIASQIVLLGGAVSAEHGYYSGTGFMKEPLFYQ